MWKLESNVNPFSQQTTTTTDNNNNSGQSDQCVFPAKADDTKICKNSSFEKSTGDRLIRSCKIDRNK